MLLFERPFCNRMKPVSFHGYTSRTRDRVINIRCDTPELQDTYRSLQFEFLSMFNSAGIPAHADNKIVFVFDLNGHRVCYGFYDWCLSIGLNYTDDNERIVVNVEAKNR